MKITVNAFQSLGDVDIEVSGLTVLVGRSNLGKSALVRAIEAAFFNKGGDEFVRRGAKESRVMLTGLPTMATVAKGRTLNISWFKGSGTNRFVVDGVVFDKVGQSAPPDIAAAGYRRVWIGDKDRGRGEDITPQVAEQFDPPFLLKEPGSFVNDVLSVVSRLGVLVNASGRCARDLKEQKRLQTLRQKDLTAAEAHVEALRPVVELHQRVQALGTAVEALQVLAATVQQVRTLVAQREALTYVCTLRMPAPSPSLAPVEESLTRLTGGRQLSTARRAVVPVFWLRMPSPTDVGRLREAERLAKVRVLVARRPAAVRAARLFMPEGRPREQQLEALMASRALYLDAATQTAALAAAADVLYDALKAVNGAEALELEAKSALEETLAALKVCPVCERVMESETAAV